MLLNKDNEKQNALPNIEFLQADNKLLSNTAVFCYLFR